MPAPVAALSLGGIWNGDVVPASRTGLAGWLTAVLVVALALLGLRTWRAVVDRHTGNVMVACWVAGVGGALLTWAAPDAVGWFASHVPGGGVFRDGARLLVLAAPAVATAVGAGVAAVVTRVDAGAARFLVGAGLVVMPVLLLADAFWGVGGRLAAVTYPASYPTMRAAVSAGPPGDVLVLPFSSFRRPDWNDSHVVLDPVGRYQPRNYLSSDVLVVSGVPIPGEDPRVAAGGEALALATPAERSAALADLGVALVVTDRTARGSAPDVAGRTAVARRIGRDRRRGGRRCPSALGAHRLVRRARRGVGRVRGDGCAAPAVAAATTAYQGDRRRQVRSRHAVLGAARGHLAATMTRHF